MSFIYYNPNPANKSVGDCVIRALSLIMNDSWSNIYADLTMQGAFLFDMPNSNSVWGEYLKANGFTYGVINDTCPYCYTVRDFCRDHPYGTYVLATGTHVIGVIDGDYYDTADSDTADSGSEVPIYYFKKGNK